MTQQSEQTPGFGGVITKSLEQRFGPALVSNLAYVVLITVICIIFAMYFLHDNLLAMFGMVIIVIIAVGLSIWFLCQFAVKNPHLALTQGSDFRQIWMQMAGKDLSVIPPTTAIEAPPPPTIIQEAGESNAK